MPYNIRQQPMHFTTGDPETVNEASWPYPGQVGMRATVQQPGPRTAPGVESGRAKTYQLVRTDSTMTVAPFPGATAWWSDRTNYTTTTAATNRNDIAGVYQANITPGNYCFVQTQGPATVKIIDSAFLATVAQDAIIPSSTAGKADRVAAGTAPTYKTLGFVATNLNKDLGNATVVVDLDVPETV